MDEIDSASGSIEDFTEPMNESNAEIEWALPTWRIFTTVIPVVAICISVIAGNLLVIVAINTQKSLKTMSNIYIMSLAVADLLVGLLILPLAIIKTIIGKWVLGRLMCHFWVTADVTLCTVSILHLCIIAFDRYRCVTDGIGYMQRRTKRSMSLSVLTIWVVALWISSPPLLGWNNWVREEESKCELTDVPGYVIHSAFGSLLFPLAVMFILYIRIYRAIQERFSERQKMETVDYSTDCDLTSDKGDGSSNRNSLVEPMPEPRSKFSIQSQQIQNIVKNKIRVSLSRERKAAKTLGIIMAAFCGCWLPFGFMYVITPFLPTHKHPGHTVVQLLTWLGYFNSALNPIIYTIFSLDFRKGFKRVLRIRT